MINLINGDLINAPRQGIGPDHALRGWDAGIDQYCRRKWRPQTTKKTTRADKENKNIAIGQCLLKMLWMSMMVVVLLTWV